jgi:predicted GNAT superfamily acetyltransferase
MFTFCAIRNTFSMPEIIIRPLESHADFHAAEDVARRVWESSDLEVVPLHMLITIAHNGGLALGAFDGDRLIGFVLGFIGTDDTTPNRPALAHLKHCSHQLGVLAEYRDQNVGYQLKLAQRDFVLKQGIRLITWTYDPLESRNAHLNIARLGAVCRTYIENLYGQMDDGLNAGLPSDRFQVDWWITSARVKERLFGRRAALVLDSFLSAGATLLNPTEVAPDDGLPRPAHDPAIPNSLFALVEVPSDFQAIKAHDPILAQAWRQQTRESFEDAFAAGYLVTDFFRETWEGRVRSFYALSQHTASGREATE